MSAAIIAPSTLVIGYANLMGVSRGPDAVLYLFIVVSLAINFILFKKVSESEKNFGFIEKKGKENFFRKGLVDEWKSVLKKDLIQKIEKEFYNEMKELKYL